MRTRRTNWSSGCAGRPARSAPHCGIVGTAYFLAPKDGTRTTSTGKASYRRVWKCADCRQQFSVLVGTIFEDSKVPLSKWLLAVHMMQAGKNGVAALELQRTLGRLVQDGMVHGASHPLRHG